jgi:pimeloyl-ACP methyl ester carboxylesterase
VPERRVVAGDVELALAEARPERGAGRPLLLVHGFTGAKEEFAELLPQLTAVGWHAVAPDLRGHGQSGQPEGEDAYHLGAFVDDLVRLVDALGWRTFTLVGHSMGGAVAQRLALDHPDRLDALVLMSTFHGPLALEPALVDLGIAIVDQGGMPALASALAARREADPAASAARERMEAARPGYAAWAHSKLVNCSPAMWKSMVRQFPAWTGTLSELPKLSLPVLVVVGSDDETMRTQCEQLAAVIPGAELVVMDGVRHSPHMEAPGRCLSVLTGFLQRV